MIISDLNHLETVSEAYSIEGGAGPQVISPTIQINLAIVNQRAISVGRGKFFGQSLASNNVAINQINVVL